MLLAATLSRTIRQRLEQSQFLAWLLGGCVTAYLRFCRRTTDWQILGEEDLRAALAKGPIVLVLWHSRLMMIAMHWPRDAGQLFTLRNTSPIGEVVAAVHKRFDLAPMAMSSRKSNLVASREILRRVQSGDSVGLTADGPLGPPHQIKDAPLEWARATGQPVFIYAYATRRQHRFASWDRLMMPLPFTRGAAIFRQWDGKLPRRMDDDTREQMRDALRRAIDQTTADADAMLGLPPGE